MSNRPRVYITRRLPDEVVEILRSVAEVDIFSEETVPVPRAELLRRAEGCSALLTMLTERVDAELLDRAGPTLRIVANMAVGYDNIDVEACRVRGVTVTNTPDVLTETTADLAIALMLATARRLPEAERALRSGQWGAWQPFWLTGLDLHGATVGIVGMGRIGEAVARRLAGFRTRLLYTARSRKPGVEDRLQASFVSLHELLEQSDFVVVLVPLTPETRHLIGERELQRMKRTAILVNVARGPVIDQDALVRALRERWIWAAGLDVYDAEPLPPDHPLTKLPNVVLLPHIGSATQATRLGMARLAAQNIAAVLRGEPPLTPVV
ncbi:MAG: D-glycerate dehydrogenase [Thermoflavifilum sp.]|nr:D-glycerate dehydrogenase [Thermoflavifilum sp.]MCL6514885.1 D-glycerate dehydrogenase [Alicyclobacillus sp.]